MPRPEQRDPVKEALNAAGYRLTLAASPKANALVYKVRRWSPLLLTASVLLALFCTSLLILLWQTNAQTTGSTVVLLLGIGASVLLLGYPSFSASFTFWIDRETIMAVYRPADSRDECAKVQAIVSMAGNRQVTQWHRGREMHPMPVRAHRTPTK